MYTAQNTGNCCTSYIVQCTVYPTQNTGNCCTLYIVQCPLHSVHYTEYINCCIMYSVHCTEYRKLLYLVHCTVYPLQKTGNCFTLYCVHCKLCRTLSKKYIICSTLYIVMFCVIRLALLLDSS